MNEWKNFKTEFHNFFSDDPNVCANLGIEKNEGNLPDPSLERVQERCNAAELLKVKLAAIPSDRLPFDDRIDMKIARLHLDKFLVKHGLKFNNLDQLQQLPKAGEEISSGMFMYFVNDPRPVDLRLHFIQSRLEAVPAYLEKLLSRLVTVQQRWRNMDLAQIGSLPDFFRNIIAWAEAEGFRHTAGLHRAVTNANTALEQYAQKLAALPTTDAIFIGQPSAETVVRSRGINLSFSKLHQIAKEFLSENARVTEDLRCRLVKKYNLAPDTATPELQTYLNEKFAVTCKDRETFVDILDRYQKERQNILEYIGARDLFPIFADQDLLIMKTPKFMEPTIPAGAMMSPPPFRTGTKQSVVYLTLREDVLAEHTEISIPAMMVHEGIPGHHLHLAWAAKHPSLVRRHADFMDQAEGWTTMLEDYMLDVGYGGKLEDEIRFSTKRDIARIGARVAIDLFLMTGEKDYLDVGIDCDLSSEDPFVAASSLLKAVTGFTDGRVQAELNWYSQERGYPLSYLAGNYLTHELKRDVIAKSGQPSLALDREFHRLFLSTGNMPLTLVREVFAHEGML